MKIGIITDVHSNIQALNAVLAEFDKRQVDKIMCCGDVIGLGINPEEIVQELMKRQDMLIAVIGNHEKYLLNGIPEKVHDGQSKLSEEEYANHKWNHDRISNESRDFLGKWDLSKSIEIEGKRIYMAHYALNEDGTHKEHIKHPSIEENRRLFQEVDANVYLYGHTHTYSVNHEENEWYINPGALGCPLDTNIARAGILEIRNDQIDFEAIQVEYDVEEIIEEMNALKFPFYKGILKIFYGRDGN